MLKRQKSGNFFIYIFLIGFIFIVNLPTLSMLGTALKSPSEALSSTALFSRHPDFTNIMRVWWDTNIPRNLFNSLYIALLVTFCCIIIASAAGYAISRFKGGLFNAYSTLIITFQMFPQVLLLIPLFVIVNKLGLMDTPLSVIIGYTTFNLPFSIWMLKGFYDTIPLDLEEVAIVDGASRFQSFYKIIFPLCLPGIASVAIFTFINSWNEFMLASIFLRTESILTIPVGLQRFVQQFTTDWPGMMTGSTFAAIPSLLFLFFAQKFLIEGMTAGSVKG